MENHRIIIFIFALVLALGCNADKKTYEGCTVGSWYDDLNSPNFLDATFNITNDNGLCKLHRVNGDSSEGEYILDINKTELHKRGDKFGAYYIATSAGLEIYDAKGFVRIAKPLKKQS